MDIRIEKLGKDEKGEFAILCIEEEPQSVNVRIGIDQFTYKHLHSSMQSGFFDSLGRKEHKYYLGWYSATGSNDSPEDRTFSALIECRHGKKKKQIPVPCSQFFAQNIQWFKENYKSPDDVKHLIVNT